MYGRIPRHVSVSSPYLLRATLLLILLLSVPVISGLKTSVVYAATFTVTKTADTNDGACDGDCSLREAIVATNAIASADPIQVIAISC